MGIPLLITVRFGKKDGDLMRMAAQYRISDMVKLAVKNYLGETSEQIPLPPNIPFKIIRCATVYLNKEDEEIIAFFEKFPSGYRSAAVKMLLRHTMEKCDLRHLLEPDPEIEAKTCAAPPKPQYMIPVKERAANNKTDKAGNAATAKPERLELPQEPETWKDDEDSVFDLI